VWKKDQGQLLSQKSFKSTFLSPYLYRNLCRLFDFDKVDDKDRDKV